jgi:2-methylcitrate dehydratase PrpD
VLKPKTRRRLDGSLQEARPPQAVHWAKVGILDTVGVTVAGSVESAARILGRVVPPTAGASLFVRLRRPHERARRGVDQRHRGAALDFDDCNNTLGGHPSAPILPALFALADERPVDGRAFITAYVAGFETECKLALGVNFHHYTKGWHATATLGVHGAAAAIREKWTQPPRSRMSSLGHAVRHTRGFPRGGRKGI